MGRIHCKTKILKAYLALTLIFMLHVSASVKSQILNVDLKVTDTELRSVIDDIEKQCDYVFFFNENDVNIHRKLDIKLHKADIDEVVLKVFGEDYEYRVTGKLIVVSAKETVVGHRPNSQIQRTISGTVTDVDGVPLPGVNVLILNTNKGVSSDFDGKYSIGADTGDILVFSYIGMKNAQFEVRASDILNVTMTAEATGLSEVILTAFGIEREKKALGYAAQELKGDALKSAKEVNLANYLTGNVAGVQVSNSASGIGGSTNVTIRGNSSLTGSNQPLYVVDGVPIINQSNSAKDAGLFGGNDYGDGIGNINPDDVESITVLKGPNASALYGSRGANGVIVIKTKSGKEQNGIGVEFNSTTSIQTINQIPKTQNKYALGYEGTNLEGSLIDINGTLYEDFPSWLSDSWGPPLDGRRVVVDPFLLPGESPRPLTLLPQDKNNIRDFYEVGVVTNNSISLSGGSENTKARLSIGNTYNKGIIPNNSGKRNTINLRVNSKLTDKLSFDTKINYTNTDFDNRPTLGFSSDNIVTTLVEMGRHIPLDFMKEYYELTKEHGNFPGLRLNPYYTINEIKNHDERNRFIGFVSLRYDFAKWLSLSVRSGIDYFTDERKNIWPVGAKAPNVSGRFTQASLSSKELNSDFLLTANGSLSDNFSASFSVGGNQLTQYNSSTNLDARNLKVPGVYNVSNAVDIRPSSALREKEIQSLYAMGQLSYKNYLFVDITGRNDWSSTLGKGNYSFFYPSIGLSWVFTDALKINSDMVTFGKLRGSWAQVGNDSDPYLTLAGYNSFTTGFNGQGYASAPSQLPALNLKNELTESVELGFDLRLFKNRIGVDMTYYDSKTKDQILPIQISNSSGYQTSVINAGEIKNSGVELTFNAGIFRSNSGFNWDLGFNYSKNKSKVVELAPNIETLLLIDNVPNDIEARVGEAFGNIIGYKYKRSPDGRKIIGSGGGHQAESEKSILGNITPDWIGGLNNSFSYKGFSMNVLVDFVQGGEMSSRTKFQMVAKGTGLFTEEGRRPRDTDDNGAQLPYVGVLDGVVEVLDANGNVTGYEENTKAVDGQTYWANRAWSGIGEEFVLDASYIMLREVTLGYDVPSKILKNSMFNSLRFTLVGRNLFYLEEHMQNMGISPESAPSTAPGARGIEGLSMPTTRSFGLNVNLTF